MRCGDELGAGEETLMGARRVKSSGANTCVLQQKQRAVSPVGLGELRKQ